MFPPLTPCPRAAAPGISCELAIGYGLILLVIWTPRPAQRWLYWAALAWFVLSFSFSFPGWKEFGFSRWILALVRGWLAWPCLLAAAASMLASSLHTLHRPSGLMQWVMTFGGYAVWSLAQQFLMQGYFLLRLLRCLPT